MKRKIVTIWLSVIVLGLTVIEPSLSWAGMSVLLYDNFVDGNYNGWIVQSLALSLTHPTVLIQAPKVTSSPEGFALVGTDSSNPALWYNGITTPLAIVNADAISIEMRARSGPTLASTAIFYIGNGDEFYHLILWGGPDRREIGF